MSTTLLPHEEPPRKFRFLAYISDIKPLYVYAVKSLPEEKLEVTFHWERLLDTPLEPSLQSNKIEIKLLDRDGCVVQLWHYRFASWELLPFDLDYGSSDTCKYRILFSDVRRVP